MPNDDVPGDGRGLSGEDLRRARFGVNLSQQEAAERIGVQPNTVGRWERGEAHPRGRIYARMLEVYGLEVSYGLPQTIGDRLMMRIAALEARIEDLEAEVQRLRSGRDGGADPGSVGEGREGPATVGG